MRTKTKFIKLLLTIIAVISGTVISGLIQNSAAQTGCGPWITVAPIQTPVTHPAAGVLNGELYVVGGEFQFFGHLTNAVQVYNPVTDVWHSVQPLPYVVEEAGAASAIGRLFVIGGDHTFPSTSLSTVSIYDPLTDTWASGSTMAVAKLAFVTAEVNGKIYALGGYRDETNTTLVDAEVYDPVLDQWMTLPPLPSPRRAGAGAAVGTKIYLFGGADGSGSQTDTVFEFDTGTNTWASKSPMPVARYGIRAAVLDGLVYVMGGVTSLGSGSQVDSRVDVYDPLTDSWSTGVPLPEQLENVAAGAIANSIVVTGGANFPDINANTYTFSCPALPTPTPAPPTITVTDGDGNAVACGGTKTVSNDGQCGAVTVPLTITATNHCPVGTVTVTSTRSDGRSVTDPYPVGSTTVTVTATDDCGNTSTCTFTVTVTNNKAITSNFNGTPIAGNKYIWFNAVLKPSGLNATSGPVTVRFFNQQITSSHFNLNVPDSIVTFDPNATCASAIFANGRWMITAPKSGLSGNTFLSGLSYQVPAAGLPGGIDPVSWSGTFITDTAGVSLNWKWAAAVYTNFDTNPSVLGVKATDDNHHDCTYSNSDHAGTPEQYKSSVTGGARGGGGSDYTGSLSGTQGVAPCDTF